MNIQPQSKQNRIINRVLVCLILPLLAILSFGIKASVASSDSHRVKSQNTNLLFENARMTETAKVYLPFHTAPLLSAAIVQSTRPTQIGANYAWTLTWSQEGEPEDAVYLIRESNSPSMSPILNTYNATTRSHNIVHPPSINNVYYYTVEVVHPRSVKSATTKVISAYWDDFNDPSSGWDTRRQDFDETNNVMSYENGNLKMHVRGRWDYFITSPLATAPAPPYRIKTRVKFAGPGNLNTYGIIFGGDNNGGECPSVFPPARATDSSQEEFDILPIGVRAPSEASIINNVVDNCLNRYYRMMFLWKDGFESMLGELKEVYYHSENNSGRGEAISGNDFLELPLASRNANGWNHWTIEVYPDGIIRVFSGPDKVVEVQSETEYLLYGTAFGFWASTDEYPGSDPLYDHILVEPIN